MSKITIGKKEYDIIEKILNQRELYFYEENPRVYSILNAEGATPTQDEIEEKLSSMDHVKQLRFSIEQNGGIIDPLIIVRRKGDYVVLEGNSRLAAYRLLAKKDPAKWQNVRCSILPDDISDDDIFTLLGQYHLVGRKDWSVFEQAAYIYRKKKESGLDNDILAKNVGLTTGTVDTYLRVYTFMVDHNDLRAEKWSYYDEFLKNRGIRKYRDTSPEIDETFVNQVKTDQIKQAIDVRNVLGEVAKASDKTAKKIMQKVIDGSVSIYEAHEQFEATGKTGGAYIKVKKFRETVADNDFQKNIKLEATNTKDLAYELRKIKTIVEKLLSEIDQ